MKPVVVYESETWAMTWDGYEKNGDMGDENTKKDIWSSGRTGTWRIRTNSELRELYK